MGDAQETTALETLENALDTLLSNYNPEYYSQYVGFVNASPNPMEFVRFKIDEDITAEEQEIIAKAKANGTYLKAPNGKPTNLTPRQWVQVRTKSFKRWFGDWELAAKIVKNVFISSSIKDRKEALQALANLKEKQRSLNADGGEYFICNDTGDKIYVSTSDAKHTMGFRNDDQIKLIGDIDKVISNAVFLRTEEPKADEPAATLAIKIYYTPVNINGVQYSARLTVKEYEKGNFVLHELHLYNAQLRKIEIPDAQRTRFNETPSHPSGILSEYKVIDLIHNTQKNDQKLFSKVVDANGEPLVVYHGSNWKNITTFDRSQSKRRRSGLREYGHFFTTNRALAEMYAAVEDAPDVKEEIDSLDAQIEQAAEAKDIGKMLDLYTEKERIIRNLGGRVYEVFLNLRDVAEFDADYQADKGWYNLKADVGYKTAIGRDAMEAYAGQNSMTGDRLRKDGIIGRNIIDLFVGTENKEALKPYYDKYGGDVFLVFDPQNIKSASENVGTFDTNNPDIRYRTASEDARQRAIAAQAQTLSTTEIEEYVNEVAKSLPEGVKVVVTNSVESDDREHTGWYDK